ncbi:hypothetical protein EJ03DRAFT_329712 [Teratosphaeria nubilosa]|uniref:Secreted protein n=1 Tax=Teratosphaeria nubilosa TaxID=161662 RepID=A0A6G1L1T7_9PEZI|nr:hypothetical protein EJ03DRAFT_329712 [Teratosphaeria nubilosa]
MCRTQVFAWLFLSSSLVCLGAVRREEVVFLLVVAIIIPTRYSRSIPSLGAWSLTCCCCRHTSMDARTTFRPGRSSRLVIVNRDRDIHPPRRRASDANPTLHS